MTAEDTVIVGAGPIGLACAISAQVRGIDPLVVDAGAVVNSIVHYPIGMTFFTTPERLEIGGHPLVCAAQKPTREEALMYYRGVVRANGIRVRTHARLVSARPEPSAISCELEEWGTTLQMSCRRLVLATGYFDWPNRLGVPGEDLGHVSHYFDEGHRSYGLDVAVIGGRNSAVEAALDLFRAGARVTLVYRRAVFPPSVKYWLKPDVENRIAAGEISARMPAEVLRIKTGSVVIRRDAGRADEIPAQRVYALTGFQPDFDLFRRIGIELVGDALTPTHDPDTLETNVPGVYVAGSITAGKDTSDIFIENGRFDGEKIFG